MGTDIAVGAERAAVTAGSAERRQTLWGAAHRTVTPCAAVTASAEQAGGAAAGTAVAAVRPVTGSPAVAADTEQQARSRAPGSAGPTRPGQHIGGAGPA